MEESVNEWRDNYLSGLQLLLAQLDHWQVVQGDQPADAKIGLALRVLDRVGKQQLALEAAGSPSRSLKEVVSEEWKQVMTHLRDDPNLVPNASASEAGLFRV